MEIRELERGREAIRVYNTPYRTRVSDAKRKEKEKDTYPFFDSYATAERTERAEEAKQYSLA